MKVFVTGTNGFIGSSLVKKLLEKNHEVYGLVRYISNRSPNLPKDVNIVYGDIRDFLLIKKTIKDIQPEAVFHLGAMTAVAESFAHPYEFTETNFIGTINLAEANLDNQNLRRFLFAGSSEEYGNQETFPIKETATLLPNTPYGISKVAADFYLQYLRLAYDFPACTVRPFNTMGRVENFNFVSEIIITQMLRNKEIIVLGDPSPVRDFLYLDDHVAGYLTILESKKLPKTVNLCSGRGVSIKELVAIISGLIGWEGEVSWTRSYRRPTEIFKLVGDNSLAKSLGWEPKFTLEEGLKLAIEKIREKIQLR